MTEPNQPFNYICDEKGISGFLIVIILGVIVGLIMGLFYYYYFSFQIQGYKKINEAKKGMPTDQDGSGSGFGNQLQQAQDAAKQADELQKQKEEAIQKAVEDANKGY